MPWLIQAIYDKGPGDAYRFHVQGINTEANRAGETFTWNVGDIQEDRFIAHESASEATRTAILSAKTIRAPWRTPETPVTTKAEQIAVNDARIAELESRIARQTMNDAVHPDDILIPGAIAWCDKRNKVTIVAAFPEGSTFLGFPHYKVRFGGEGSEVTSIAMSRIGTEDPTPKAPPPPAPWEPGFRATMLASDLSLALKRAGYVCERRSSLPILSHVRIDVCDTRAFVEANDLELRVTSLVSTVDVSVDGSACVPLKPLADALKGVAKGTSVTLSSERKRGKDSDQVRVTVTIGASTVTLVGIDARDWPGSQSLPAHAPMVALDGKAFAAALEAVAYAMSTDETQYNLCGALVKPDADTWELVATDGHRMACDKIASPGMCGLPEKGVIVPRKGVSALCKILSEKKASEGGIGFFAPEMYGPALETGGMPTCSVNPFAVYQRADVELCMRLVDGQFPDYRQVIPSGEGCTRVTVDAEALVSTLARFSKDKSVKAYANGALHLSQVDPDTGETKASVDATREGEEVTIGLNTRYLLEAIRASGAATLAMDVKRPDPEDRQSIEWLAANKGGTLATMGTLAPIVMRHGARVAVIMPMRVN